MPARLPAGSEVPWSARELLLVIFEGDPLGLERRLGQALRGGGFVVPCERGFERCVARVASVALRYDGAPLETWLSEQVGFVVRDMIAEQREDERTGVPVEGPRGERPDEAAYYRAMAPWIGVDVAHARLACVALNHLPAMARRTARAILVEGRTLDRFVSTSGLSVTEVRAHVRQARRTMVDTIATRTARAHRAG